MDIEVDTSELRALEVDFGRIPVKTVPAAEAVMKKAATNIKQDWRDAWTGLAHAPALPRAVTYDRTTVLGGIGYEIGPDKTKPQGALGNLIEFGSVNNAPHPGGLPALQKEEPRLEKAIERIVGDILEG